MAKPCSPIRRARPNEPAWSRLSARSSSPVWAVKPSGTAGSTASSSSASVPEPRRKTSWYSSVPSVRRVKAWASKRLTVPPSFNEAVDPNAVRPTISTSSWPPTPSTVTESPTARSSSSAVSSSMAICPSAVGASPSVTSRGLSSSSETQSSTGGAVGEGRAVVVEEGDRSGEVPGHGLDPVGRGDGIEGVAGDHQLLAELVGARGVVVVGDDGHVDCAAAGGRRRPPGRRSPAATGTRRRRRTRHR